MATSTGTSQTPSTIGTAPRLSDTIGLAARLIGQGAVLWGLGVLPGDPTAKLFLPRGRRDPYGVYAELRSRGPIVPTRLGVKVSTSHRVCGDVLRSRAFGVAAEGGQPDIGISLSLLELDPPDHTRLRRLVTPAFSPRRIKALETMISTTVHRLLGRAEAAGDFDLVADFAAPLPIEVITALLGIPVEDQAAFRRHGDAIASALDGIRSVRHARALDEADRELGQVFGRLLELRRVAPQEDLISDLAAAPEDAATTQELLELCRLLLVAGFETTVNLIGNTVLALHRSGQWSMLAEDPDLAGAAIEETLRYDPPVQLTGRTATADTEVGGHRVNAGEHVVTLIGASGRDPEVFSRPDTYDLTRPKEADHLAFSAGAHYCIGAPLARLEATVAIRELATRFPRLASTGRAPLRRTTVLRGPQRVPVRIVD
ncbi:cytochrome P450 [Microlunatus sp. Y2014]|uniref:cytochrome P450 n=1 Tax=Microlunatus sp. Y2014 TaxID=3418488 RepID=UPI003DA78E9F